MRMSDIVPRTATEEAWRSMYVTRRVDNSVRGGLRGGPCCRSIGEKSGPCHSTECRQRFTKMRCRPPERARIKLDEEQKRRDAFTARRDDVRHPHAPVAESPSSSVEHEKEEHSQAREQE